MNFGHYYAVCKENDKWICYNDTNIQEIDKKNAFALSPYCLFYKRII
jgi:ubiquitin C-terminal hydrolase